MATETNADTKLVRTLTDADIADFISEVSKKRIKLVQESLTIDQIASIGFNSSQLYEAVSRIVEYPTKFQIDHFKESSTDKTVLYLLQSPEVLLGLELKNDYDLGKLDIFDKILKFREEDGLHLEEDKIIVNFMKDSEYFLPPMPEIEEEDLKSQIESNENISNLSCLGKGLFESIADSYLFQRFADREIKEISIYTINPKIVSRWAELYQLPIRSENSPDQEFFAYVGALCSQISFSENKLKADIKNWITIILEPILIQFDNANELKVNGKDEIRSILKDAEFRNIYTSTHPEPVYIVQIYAGGGRILVGTSSSKSLAEAEAKASTNALYDTPVLEKARKLIEEERRSTMSVSPYTGEISQYNNPNTVQSTYQPYQHQLNRPVYPREQTKAVAQASYMSQDPSNSYPQGLINEEYQRKLYEENESILEAPPVTDDSAIDISSKEKLNQLLMTKRIAPAEYKTAKLNSSNVQVICYIENIPIAKATSTNKKKAGQICAQYILNYPEYFLQRYAHRS